MRRPPGKVHIYSNIGYIFLGRVVEVVSTQTYEEFVRQQILKPLNITASIGHKQRNERQDLEVGLEFFNGISEVQNAIDNI